MSESPTVETYLKSFRSSYRRAARTDEHRPSVLNPADYEEVGDFDLHAEDGYMWVTPEARGVEPYEDGPFANRGACDHCGQRIRYGVLFHHKPSDKLVAVGLTCAHTLNMSSRTEKEIKAKAEQARLVRAIEAWANESPDNMAALDYFNKRRDAESAYRDAMAEWNDRGNPGPAPRAPRYNDFVDDVARKLRRYGSLSEKQVAAVLKSKERDEEFEARRQAEEEALKTAPALADGRYEIEGTVISVKWVEGFSTGWDGRSLDTKKMLVKMDDGNKVFGTVPSAILEADKGTRVKFTAKVEPKEEHFGFFSRPTKPEIIEASE